MKSLFLFSFLMLNSLNSKAEVTERLYSHHRFTDSTINFFGFGQNSMNFEYLRMISIAVNTSSETEKVSENCRKNTSYLLSEFLRDYLEEISGVPAQNNYLIRDERTISTKNFVRRLREFLQRPSAFDEECFDLATKSYALVSLAALAGQFEGSVSKDLLRYGQLALKLFESGRLQSLTLKRRQDFGASQWLWKIKPKKADEGFAIQGGYDCTTQTVYFDPLVGPFDLATSLIHEMEHLIRDVFSDSGMGFSENTREDVLVEEVMATLRGAYEQVALIERSGMKERVTKLLGMPLRRRTGANFIINGVTRLLGRKIREKRYENLSGDISMVSSDGIVNNLWKSSPDSSSGFGGFFQNTVRSSESERNAERVEKLIQQVSRAYFSKNFENLEGVRTRIIKEEKIFDLWDEVEKSGELAKQLDLKGKTPSLKCQRLMALATNSEMAEPANDLSDYLGFLTSMRPPLWPQGSEGIPHKSGRTKDWTPKDQTKTAKKADAKEKPNEKGEPRKLIRPCVLHVKGL